MNETVKKVNYKNIIGKQAFFAKENRFAGTVKDIVFGLDQKKAVALILEKGLLPKLRPAVLFTDIVDIISGIEMIENESPKTQKK